MGDRTLKFTLFWQPRTVELADPHHALGGILQCSGIGVYFCLEVSTNKLELFDGPFYLPSLPLK